MIDYQLYIDGEFCEASDGGRFPSINPATGEHWATAPAATEDDVDRTVRAARRAVYEGAWADMTATQRGRMLFRLAELIEREAHHLGEVETTDSGKLAAETRAQTAYVADYYRYYGGLADKIQGATLPIDKPDMHVFTTREPIGVVAAVVPWNAEMFLTATKVGPALAAGNAVVIKASEDAPAPLLEFAEHQPASPARTDLILHSLAAACCARSIAATAVSDVDPRLAYSAGLLHDIGKLALQDIMPRSVRPTCSRACDRVPARRDSRRSPPASHSAIHSRANSPDCTSERIFFISSFTAGVTTRGPRTYPPYSAVSLTE